MGTCYQAGSNKPPKLCEKGKLKDVSKMEERLRLEGTIRCLIWRNGAEGQTQGYMSLFVFPCLQASLAV